VPATLFTLGVDYTAFDEVVAGALHCGLSVRAWI
jgi:hypothetical protein